MNGVIYRMDCTRAWFLLGTLAQLLLHIFHILYCLYLIRHAQDQLFISGCGGLEILADVGAGGELYKSSCR